MQPIQKYNYNQLYAHSIEQPDAFWLAEAKALSWFQQPTIGYSETEEGLPQWFADGQLNACYLALDYHIDAGLSDQVALIYDSPVTQTQQRITYGQMHREVSQLAGGLQALGLQVGDTVVIYMPMIPQAVYAMLACARIGVTHSVVFGGFAPHELAIRIDDCKPKVLITASSGIEVAKLIAYKPMVDDAISLATHQPNKVVVFNRKLGARIPFKPYDVDYDALVYGSDPVDCVSVPSTHPLYILYTSGTTGKPKGIVRDTGGYATALYASMKYIYGAQPGAVFWAASDVGWVVGHSYIVYGPLIYGCPTVIFEGKPVRTPDASTFWRVIAEHQVAIMFTAPTAIRAIKKEDPNGLLIKKYDVSCLRTQFLAGERCDKATLAWFQEHVGVPAIDHWWQTESGWPMLATMATDPTMPIVFGAAGKPVLGYDIQIRNEQGEAVAPTEEGFVVVKWPLPPGTLSNLWGDTERFKSGYLQQMPGFYFSGDGGYQDENGHFFITGRVDDVINVAGHRLSTSEMEEVLSAHPAVAECAVVGIDDALKGQIPVGLVVEKTGMEMETFQIQYELVQLVRDQIGAVASLRNILVVKRLPKTRSGKILRKVIRAIFDNMPYQVPSTIEDMSCLDEIKQAWEEYQEQQPKQL